MSWRTVVISSRCKLDMKMGYLVIRSGEVKRIFVDEIGVLMIENPAVSLTGCLLEALMQKKIKVIFCDSKRSPMAELIPYYGSHDCSRKLQIQTAWSEEVRGAVWGRIIAEKIRRQAEMLAEQKEQRSALLLESYIEQIEFQDATNREGHAAKVYFNALFGKDFTRKDASPANVALNYGYSILLSAFNREITGAGYLTQLGLHHDNGSNPFNLSSDLMEPYRILIDRKVVSMLPVEFDKEAKMGLVNILNESVTIDNSCQTVLNSIKIYVRSVIEALNSSDPGLIKFYQI